MALQTKVRRAFIATAAIHVVGGTTEVEVAAAAFVAQDKVRIIGAELNLVIDPSDQTLVADMAMAMINITTVPGQLAGLIAMLNGAITNIGESFGDTYKHLMFFFPEGHGLDLDEEEAVFLGYNFSNNMAATTIVMSGSAIIYYVER